MCVPEAQTPQALLFPYSVLRAFLDTFLNHVFKFVLLHGFYESSSGILSKPPANQTPLLVVEEADAVHGHGHAVAPRAGQHRLVLHRPAGLDDVLDAELGGDVHVVREGEERV